MDSIILQTIGLGAIVLVATLAIAVMAFGGWYLAKNVRWAPQLDRGTPPPQQDPVDIKGERRQMRRQRVERARDEREELTEELDYESDILFEMEESGRLRRQLARNRQRRFDRYGDEDEKESSDS